MDVERVRADLLQAFQSICQRRNTSTRCFGFGRPSGAASRLHEMKAPSTVEDRLKSVSRQELLFMNVWQFLKLLLVTPVTTVSVERANSALGFVKSDHHSMMSEGLLNALLRPYVHKDIQLDFEEVVTTYGNKHPRRMLLGRPLHA